MYKRDVPAEIQWNLSGDVNVLKPIQNTLIIIRKE
jgi:hypothetical protein